MERYGTHCEQTYRTNFNRGRAKCIDWMKLNLALCQRYLNMDGLLAIAIDPSYISKSGKQTPHIGTFWSGYASFMKHGLGMFVGSIPQPVDSRTWNRYNL